MNINIKKQVGRQLEQAFRGCVFDDLTPEGERRLTETVAANVSAMNPGKTVTVIAKKNPKKGRWGVSYVVR